MIVTSTLCQPWHHVIQQLPPLDITRYFSLFYNFITTCICRLFDPIYKIQLKNEKNHKD